MLTTDRKNGFRRYFILGVIVLIACGLAFPEMPGVRPAKAQPLPSAGSPDTKTALDLASAAMTGSNAANNINTLAGRKLGVDRKFRMFSFKSDPPLRSKRRRHTANIESGFSSDLTLSGTSLFGPYENQKTGSILFFNVYTKEASSSTSNTRVNITNTNTSSFGTAFVHLYFVAEGCSIADSYICLTPSQTVSFLTSDLDPRVSGYVVVLAVDSDGSPRSFDWLMGESLYETASRETVRRKAEAKTFGEVHFPKEDPPPPPSPSPVMLLTIMAASHSKDDIPKQRATAPQARLSYLQSAQQLLPSEPLWSSQTGTVPVLTRNLFARSSLHGSDADGAEASAPFTASLKPIPGQNL